MAFKVVKIKSWSQYRDLVNSDSYRSWGFRGQSDGAWPLLSSLSRYLQYARVHRDAWAGQEKRILRIFRRKAHLFLQHIPPEKDSFQWLGLMQHHGAPTRMLDLTWSPYVALFFALERGSRTAAVWGFNAGTINESSTHELKDGTRIDVSEVSTWVEGCYEDRFLPNKEPFVIIGEPKIMNQRLIAQSGTFIIPGVIDKPIEDLIGSYKGAKGLLVKLLLDADSMRKESMYALYNMNITFATLFPGLDGLARSMAYEFEYHWAFDPMTMKPWPGFPPPHELGYWGYKEQL
jgi:hypothetical protein